MVQFSRLVQDGAPFRSSRAGANVGLMSGVKEGAWASRMARRTREVIWRCAATDDQTCESTVLFRVCAGVWTPASCALCPLRRTRWARSDPAPRCCFLLQGDLASWLHVAVHAPRMSNDRCILPSWRRRDGFVTAGNFGYTFFTIINRI